MRKFTLLFLFLFIGFGAFAQYGKLEKLSPNNESIYVLRTPDDVINKLQDTTDKVSKRKAQYITNVEQQLESARQGFLSLRLPAIDVQSFLSSIKYLESKGVDISYYVQEYFYYYPNRRNSR